eukprot:scaffold15670_cov112-Isochrysis_galbana.AAC.9
MTGLVASSAKRSALPAEAEDWASAAGVLGLPTGSLRLERRPPPPAPLEAAPRVQGRMRAAGLTAAARLRLRLAGRRESAGTAPVQTPISRPPRHPSAGWAGLHWIRAGLFWARAGRPRPW